MILVYLILWLGVLFVFLCLVIISGDDNLNVWFLFKMYMSKLEYVCVLLYGIILIYWLRVWVGILKGFFDFYLVKISKYFKVI